MTVNRIFDVIKNGFFYNFLFLVFFASGLVFADEEFVRLESPKVAGEFLGITVPMDNYLFAKSAVMVFGTRWGGQPQTPEELEDRVWDDLLLSYQAHQDGVVVDISEVHEEIDKILKAEKVEFDRVEQPDQYEAWVKERTRGTVPLFENLLKHLIQLQKVRKKMIENVEADATEEEAFDEFLNEYNTLSVEFVHFHDLKEAQAFYRKNKKGRRWKRLRKKDPEPAVTKPGFISLEALIDLWKVPKEDAYAMLNLKIGSVYKPTPIYRGYAVFRTLEKRVADEAEFEKRRGSYFDQIRRKKQYEGFNEWFKELKARANIKSYVFLPPSAKTDEAAQQTQ